MYIFIIFLFGIWRHSMSQGIKKKCYLYTNIFCNSNLKGLNLETTSQRRHIFKFSYAHVFNKLLYTTQILHLLLNSFIICCITTHTHTHTFSMTLHTYWHHRIRKMITTSRRIIVTKQPIRIDVLPSSGEPVFDGVVWSSAKHRRFIKVQLNCVEGKLVQY